MRQVAIVGAGFSGSLQAVHLLDARDTQVTLIDRAAAFGPGVAYSTLHDGHLLNVRAGNMSALPDQPDHFIRWLAQRRPGRPAGFATRRLYGEYLRQLLDDAGRAHPGRLRRLHGEAVDIARTRGRYDLTLGDGRRIDADVVVLAPGNLPPLDPPPLAAARLPADLYQGDPWAGNPAEDLDGADTVVLIGTGLTMVDVVLKLEAEGFAGHIVAISRHGLLPRAHDGAPPGSSAGAGIPAGPPQPLALLRHVRRRADAVGWRTAVDELRPVTQRLWHDADHAAQRRFLHHLRPWWDVHRHRLAPQVAARVAALAEAGRLSVRAGRLRTVEGRAREIRLTWHPAGAADAQELRARRLINCTGPQGDLGRTHEPLLRLLQAAGLVRPDPHGLGIDVNRRSEALDAAGRPVPGLFVAGPMSRGAFWEIVAVPDIRVQVKEIAQAISAAPSPARRS